MNKKFNFLSIQLSFYYSSFYYYKVVALIDFFYKVYVKDYIWINILNRFIYIDMGKYSSYSLSRVFNNFRKNFIVLDLYNVKLVKKYLYGRIERINLYIYNIIFFGFNFFIFFDYFRFILSEGKKHKQVFYMMKTSKNLIYIIWSDLYSRLIDFSLEVVQRENFFFKLKYCHLTSFSIYRSYNYLYKYLFLFFSLFGFKRIYFLKRDLARSFFIRII